MRGVLAAIAALAVATGASAQESRTLSGVWLGEQTGREIEFPNYLRVELVEREGILSGFGHINLCGGCRGFDQHEVHWQGRIDGRRVQLHGTYPERPFEPKLSFIGHVADDGEQIEGFVFSGDRRERFILSRQDSADEAAGEPR